MRWVAAVLLCFVSLIATARADDFVDESTRIRFPEVIAVLANEPAPAACAARTVALCRGPVHRFPDPRLGIGVTYTFGGNVVTASVFIYDLGESGFPDGPASGTVEHQFESMKEEIRSMDRASNYRNLRLISEDTVTAVGPLNARTAHFSYEREGRPFLSEAYLSALSGKLIKVRVTYRADVPAGKASANVFITALGARIAEAMGQRAGEAGLRRSSANWRPS